MRAARSTAAAFLATTALGTPALHAQSSIELLSRAVSSPTTAGGESILGTGTRRSLSRDGRYVVFTSDAANLVAGQIDGNDAQDVFLEDVATGQTLIVSHSSLSPLRTGNALSTNPSVSEDGRYVAFESGATDLVAGVSDNNLLSDVFLFDRVTSVVSLVSGQASNPSQTGDGASRWPAISADGHFLAFVSSAPNLVPGQLDVGGLSANKDVFLFDRLTGSSVLVSHEVGLPSKAAGSGMLTAPAISDDGSVVAFESSAANIVAGQTGGATGAVFAYDRSTNQNALASHTVGNPANAASASLRALSGSGRYVFFTTPVALAPDDFDSGPDQYRFDRTTGVNALVSGSSGEFSGTVAVSEDGEWAAYGDGDVFLFDGSTGNSTAVSHLPGSTFPSDTGYSQSTSISADGRYVTYSSTVPDLVSGQVDSGSDTPDVFLYDRDTGGNVLVSHPSGSPLLAAGGLGTELPVISADGSVVVFSTAAPTLVSGDTNHHADVFAYTRATGALVALSLRAPTLSSASANRASAPPSGDLQSATRARISADGQQVLFQSEATNLVPGQLDDGLGASVPARDPGDVYLRDRSAETTSLVSHAFGSAARGANQPSSEPVVSADGRFVAYSSTATDLVSATFVPALQNVYLFDRATGANTLVSRSSVNPSASAAGGSFGPSISGDGRFVAFQSTAPDLVPGQVDGNTGADAFLYDRLTATTTLVSHRWDSAASAGNAGTTSTLSLSLDGRFVAFTTSATDLAPVQTGPLVANAYLFDRTTGMNQLISHPFGAPSQGADDTSAFAELSADGRYVAYRSYATDIVASPRNSLFVFLYEAGSGTNTLVSDSDPANTVALRRVMINSDGRYVVYESQGRSEVPGQTDSLQSIDVFLFDRLDGSRVLVSHEPGSATSAGFGDSGVRGVSNDGRFVLFSSVAQNLDPGGSQTGTAVYRFDRLTGSNLFVSKTVGPSDVLVGPAPFLGSDGSGILFGSTSSLAPNDFNGFGDAFLRSAPAGADLAVRKTGPASAQPGQDIVFEIEVDSVGTLPAENVVLDDPVPPGLVPGPIAGACASFPCSLGTLPAGETRQVEVTYSIPPGYSAPAPIVNVAAVSTTTADVDASNNTAFAEVTLPSAFYTVSPCRLVDTREANGPLGGPAMTAGSERAFVMPGTCGIPAGVKSVALNVTVVVPSQAGFIRISPIGAVTPQTSTINFGPGQTRANDAVISVGVGGQVGAALGMAAGQAHLILDVVGYFK